MNQPILQARSLQIQNCRKPLECRNHPPSGRPARVPHFAGTMMKPIGPGVGVMVGVAVGVSVGGTGVWVVVGVAVGVSVGMLVGVGGSGVSVGSGVGLAATEVSATIVRAKSSALGPSGSDAQTDNATNKNRTAIGYKRFIILSSSISWEKWVALYFLPLEKCIDIYYTLLCKKPRDKCPQFHVPKSDLYRVH